MSDDEDINDDFYDDGKDGDNKNQQNKNKHNKQKPQQRQEITFCCCWHLGFGAPICTLQEIEMSPTTGLEKKLFSWFMYFIFRIYKI